MLVLRLRVVSLAALALALAIPSVAEATVRYAAPDGSSVDSSGCTPPGTYPGPCDLNTAVGGPGAADNDEVIIEPGNYTEADTVDDLKKLDMHGVAGQPRPHIKIAGTYGFFVHNTASKLRHVAIDPGSVFGLDVSGVVEDVIVHNDSIAACTFWGADAILRDSVCLNTGTGAGVNYYAGGGGGPTYPLTKFNMRNVTAWATGGDGVGISLGASNSVNLELDATNVIAHGAKADVQARTDDNPTNSRSKIVLDHSNYATRDVTNSATVTDPATNANRTAPPQLADPANGDFHELDFSPTIDGGIDSPLNGLIDPDGHARKLGAAPDMGAFERAPLPPDTFAGVTIAGQSVKVKKGKAPVAVGCPAGTPPPCAGTLTLTYKIKKKHKKPKTKTAGTATFSIAAGQVVKVNVALSKRARKLLKSKKKLKTTATAVATDSRGTTKTTTGAVKLKPAKHKHKKKH